MDSIWGALFELVLADGRRERGKGRPRRPNAAANRRIHSLRGTRWPQSGKVKDPGAPSIGCDIIAADRDVLCPGDIHRIGKKSCTGGLRIALIRFRPMENKRLELKVGLFVLVGLVLVAVLLIAFSKGTSVFRGTYTVRLIAVDVGGLKLRASVLLAGVEVGSVSAITLAPDGRSVTITLNIYKGTTIYNDANFEIEQAGFLGDKYVAVIPTANQGPVITNGEVLNCEPPFDMLAVARSATGFIARVNDTVTKIDASVSQLQKTVLNEETLTNISIAIGNIRDATAHANGVVGGLDGVVSTNTGQLNLAVSNIVFFSQELTQIAANADNIVATNGAEISDAVTNLQATTATLREIADDMHEGKGLAGTVLENEQLATNVQETVNNLAIATSNLNKLGLWHILWRHEPAPHKKGSSKTSQE